jgi:hypothetical protein
VADTADKVNGIGPKGHRNPLRQAAAEAITTEHVAAIMRRALRMALEGNMAAMRLVLDRTCGRPVEVPTEGLPVDVNMPHLQTAANCTSAIDRLVEAICEGVVDRDSAKLLLDVIQTRLKAIEVNDLEQRLGDLEKALGTVDLPGRGPRRA